MCSFFTNWLSKMKIRLIPEYECGNKETQKQKYYFIIIVLLFIFPSLEKVKFYFVGFFCCKKCSCRNFNVFESLVFISNEKYCDKQNQTLPSIIRSRPTNTLKTKMGPFSSIFFINVKVLIFPRV